MPTYATTIKLKKVAFKINSQNIKQNVGMQVTFISEIKLRLERFLVKYDCYFGDMCIHFEPLLGWEYAYVCHD